VCLTHQECNCGEYSKDTRKVVFEGNLKIRFGKALRRGSGSVREWHLLWRHIVFAYSLKDMTFATDKLPALAGIASLFCGKGLGLYINGLWESTLVSDLFWDISLLFSDYNHIVVRRSEVSLMPSWSWASVDGPVDLYQMHDIEGLGIVEILFEPDKSGSLADISAKTLVLHGIFIRARIWRSPGSEKESHSASLSIVLEDSIATASWIVDVPTEVICGPNTRMDAFILCGTTGPGVVLASIEGSIDTYKRLGKIRELPKDRGSYATRTVRLV
jgi:hypothetical protein